MVSAFVLHTPSRWIICLSIVAILCGLTAHLIADAAFGAPGLGKPDQCAQNGRFNSPPAMCDLMADSLLPALAGIAHVQPVKHLLNRLSVNRLAWFPLRPIHPPIETI